MYRRKYTRNQNQYNSEAKSNTAPQIESPTMTVQEMWEYMNICRRTAYQLVKTKGFPAFRVGRSIRIDRKGLDEWIQNQSCADMDS